MPINKKGIVKLTHKEARLRLNQGLIVEYETPGGEIDNSIVTGCFSNETDLDNHIFDYGKKGLKLYYNAKTEARMQKIYDKLDFIELSYLLGLMQADIDIGLIG